MRVKTRWFGCAGHLIVASDCLFHMHTRVGDYRISTVGDYRPRHERHGDGMGPRKSIGLNRDYETFVFSVTGDGQDGEGDMVEWGEIDSLSANEEPEATINHMRMVRRYQRIARKELTGP